MNLMYIVRTWALAQLHATSVWPAQSARLRPLALRRRATMVQNGIGCGPQACVGREDAPRESDSVRAEAPRRGQTAHLGYLSGSVWRRTPSLEPSIASSRAESHSKGAVFVDHSNEYDIVHDVGRSLATLQAAKAVDFCVCLPGRVIKVADDDQAYAQGDMKGGSHLGAHPS